MPHYFKRRKDDKRGGVRPNTGNRSHYQVAVGAKYLETPNSATALAYVEMAEFLGYAPVASYGKDDRWVVVYPLKFEVGDLIYINSPNALQHGEQGMVIDVRPVAVLTYQVRTEDESTGWYRPIDLSTDSLTPASGILTIQYNPYTFEIQDAQATEEQLRFYLFSLYDHITAIEYERIVTHDLHLGPERVVAKGMKRAIYRYFKKDKDNADL